MREAWLEQDDRLWEGEDTSIMQQLETCGWAIGQGVLVQAGHQLAQFGQVGRGEVLGQVAAWHPGKNGAQARLGHTGCLGFDHQGAISGRQRARHAQTGVTGQGSQPMHFCGHVIAGMPTLGERDAQNVFLAVGRYPGGRCRSSRW